MSPKMELKDVQQISHLPDNALLNLTTVLSLFGLSKSKWYAGIKAGQYPKPVKLDRASRWVVGEIRSTLDAMQNQPR